MTAACRGAKLLQLQVHEVRDEGRRRSDGGGGGLV